ncbi:dUTP diphosphatase [Scytonema sp. NUACC26]|uniref:dUTP diphosphatase n=1 Tax=Scytonema sp. NUACC26 TaxID=3140176 RepID=UPI0034DC24F7
MQLKIKKLNPNAIIPIRAYQFDSGVDLYACIEEPITLQPLERRLIGTGIAIELPAPNTIDGVQYVLEAQVRAKSGRAVKEGLGVLNSPGTIDNGFSDEIKVIVVNLSNEPITIQLKQKIAQLVICPVVLLPITEVEKIGAGDRAMNGFGSTGI